MPTTEPIREITQLNALTDYFLRRLRFRDYVLIVLGASTALRISDLLKLQWTDVYDFRCDSFKHHINMKESKTKKPKSIKINKGALTALALLFQHRKSDSPFIFSNGRKKDKPISRVHAWRLIKKAAEAVDVTGVISCHSLRKTWGYHAWTSFEISPVVIMRIFNHSSYEVTQRYLGLTQDEVDDAYDAVELFA